MKLEPATYTPPLSPTNLQALLDLNAGRAEAAAEVDTLQARMNSLARLRDAVAPIEAELSALDASEAEALAEWSSAPDDPAPEPDITARDAIVARLTAARQRIAGATAATSSVEDVLNAAAARAANLERSTPAFIAAVLIDEARELLPAIVEATMALAKAQARYATLRKFLLERAEAARDVAARIGFFRDLEVLDREAAEAAAIGPLLSFNAGDEWKSRAIELGDTPIRPTATAPVMFPGMPEMKW
jgi:hypothetical protein